jgi:pimeloyl-ACP methyl ester carboxylesterase
VIFIHGLYLNDRCWENWRPRFEAAGFATLAPDWPGHAGDPPDLRKNVDPSLETLRLRDVVDYYRKIVQSQPEPPVLVGHSMGGLIVEILLSEGLGKAGVAIHPAPPKGVFTLGGGFFKANGPSLHGGHKPLLLSTDQFAFAFGNGVPRTESDHFYDWYVVPESRVAARGPLKKDGKLNYKAHHAPLLILGGDEDHTIPPALPRAAAAHYPAESGTVDLEIMKGRTHLTLLEPGWEQVADKVIGWLGRYVTEPG